MSDYNNPNSYDKYGNPIPGEARPMAYEPVEVSGRAPYILVGLLALVAIIGGAMYFNGGHRNGSNANVAAAPPAMERTLTPSTQPGAPTTPPAGPMNTTPAPTATPAPAGPPSTTQQ
jgi:hypothetical protein